MSTVWTLSIIPVAYTPNNNNSKGFGVSLTNQETDEIASVLDYATRKVYRFLRLPPDSDAKETRIFTRASVQSQSETIDDKPLDAVAVMLMGAYTNNREKLQPVLMEICGIDSVSALLINDFLSLPPPFYRQLLSHRHQYTHWSLGVYYVKDNKHASLNPAMKGFEPNWTAYMNTNNRYEINEMSPVDLMWLAQSQHFKPYVVLEYIDEFGIYKPEIQIPPVIIALCQSPRREGLYDVIHDTEKENLDLFVVITELIARYGQHLITDDAIRSAHQMSRVRISTTLELLKSQTRTIYLQSSSSSSFASPASSSVVVNGLHTVDLHDTSSVPLPLIPGSRCHRCLKYYYSCVIS